MTTEIIKKVLKKAAPGRSVGDSERVARFKTLTIELGAVELQTKIDHAIQESEERRRRLREQGAVTVTVP
ncbi:hypothetical protein D1006_39045 [Burkholderia stabilis]|uniref:Uncharacterized protein n=1 Tax=Burkholderia stabilis TaxID=95485 RepID=A0A4Q2A5G4_9BURK|nr:MULTISPECIES: hypothetical protein [Burkholderia]MBN3739050.1 hypothetical protein [Burkholderia sp. Tr-20355]RXV64377.1 hypothetical protein D1006_39045 [Burkholderia stabilis]